MGKLQEIINGWTNYAIKNPQIEKLAKERAEFCVDCSQLKNNTNSCKICGCYIPAKIRSTKSKCPLKKW